MAAVIQLVLCESAASQLPFIQTVSYPARQLRQLKSASQSDSCLQVVGQSAVNLIVTLSISEADSCDRMSVSQLISRSFFQSASQSVSKVERTSVVVNGVTLNKIKYRTVIVQDGYDFGFVKLPYSF